MFFEAHITTKYMGSEGITQLIHRWSSDGNTDGAVLDTVPGQTPILFYRGIVQQTYYANNGIIRCKPPVVDDGPSVLLDHNPTTCTDVLTDFASFHPDGDGIFVTLGTTGWGWNGVATQRPTGGWVLTTKVVTMPRTFDKCNYFPWYPSIFKP
jgi:hypothetical protein